MSNLIEETERQQQRYWRRTILAFISLIALLIVRYLFGYVFREYELNSHPIGILVLLISITALIVMVLSIVKLGRLTQKAMSDPRLKEALIDNEFLKSRIAESWKVGFIGAAATPLLLVLISVKDPLVVAFSAPAIGSGAFLISLYLRNRRDD